MSYPALKIRRKTGNECFTFRGRPIEHSVLHFWQWYASDFLSNSLRGVLAEFIVACALGVLAETRLEWDAYDLVTKSGKKVEVKSAAYIQTWDQNKPSRIVFGIAPTFGWEASTNTYHSKMKRHADVYVFCVLKHKNQETIDPLNLDQWDFYTLPTKKLEEQAPRQKTIALSRIKALGAELTDFGGLSTCIDKILEG